MARSVADLIADIEAACAAAIGIAGGLDAEGIARLAEQDDVRFRALKNALTEIGEAIRMLRPAFLDRHPEVPWRSYIGLRNVVTHQYFGLNAAVLSSVVNRDLPELHRLLKQLLASDDR
ncbi:HepT-like ribonuclease domain-containing protein [Salinarimonas sp. NSM]|uniref:HepT-like ribonuclease domain-containing protein n=1 Tax=Salinarimonas sp. NSM TaxID=3458003 RepID=UPI0040369E6F